VMSLATGDEDCGQPLQSKLSLTSSSGSSSATTIGRQSNSNRSSLHGTPQTIGPRSPLTANLSTSPVSPSPHSPLKSPHPQLSRASGWLSNAFASSFQNRSTRPNSTSGSGFGGSPRAVAPPKFHSLDSHMEQARGARQSIGSCGPHAPPGSPNIARQAASLDQGVSSGASGLCNAAVTSIHLENSNLQRTNSAESSPTLSRTLSISSVFSRNGSLASSMQNLGTNLSAISGNASGSPPSGSIGSSQSPATPRTSLPDPSSSCSASGAGSFAATPAGQAALAANGNTVAQATTAFLDRFAKEAKGLTREAIQATKHEISVRRTSAGGSVSGNFEFGSEQLNGLADKTSSMLSDLFSGKMVDKMKEKVQQQQAQFGGAFPNRKGMVERTQLIKHGTNRPSESSTSGSSRRSSSSSRSNRRSSGANDTRAQEAENQQFLKEICQSVLNGDGIGWLRLGRLRKLMEDENYRNFVVCRVNQGRERRLSANDQLDDVPITKGVWKGMSKLLQALVHGIEQNRTNSGQGGLQSTLQVLEIAHTHYWARTGEGGGAASTMGESDCNSTFGSVASSSVAGRNSELSSLICGLNSEDTSPGNSTLAGSRSLASTTATSPFGSSEALPIASPEASSANRPSIASNAPEALSNAYETLLQQQAAQSDQVDATDDNAVLPRIGSVDSESSDLSSATSGTTTATTNANESSDHGSMTLNPAYFVDKSNTNALGARSTCSDSEVDEMVKFCF
jgi:hypothetical protein